jgi:aspartate/methionine/tyrosine aminotransferase
MKKPLKTPIDRSIVKQEITAMGIESVGLASIRELNRIVNNIEAASGERFIRMEMGVPGLDPPKIAVDAEIEALKKGVGSKYPPFDGIPELKQEISLFVKNFIDVDINEVSCFPTVGSMQGCYLAMMCTTRRIKGKDRLLFIDPGFPVNKLQARVLGASYDHFDVYEFRGKKLESKLESYLKKGDVAALMYSNPNNPAWICFTDQELEIIGRLATKYDCIVMEDLAYFGMDFRKDYSQSGQPPFIPSVAKYTDNYILLISSSKSFSLAGQRIGMTAIPDKLFTSTADNLKEWFGSDKFGYAYIFGAMYATSSGVSHSNQYGLCGLLKAVNNGSYNFVDYVKEYGDRAAVMKRLFVENGFQIVYDMDEGEKIADGFYFTISFPGFTGVELVEELLYYGISAISLTTTGSDRHEGLRACVSLTGKDRFQDLENRVVQFKRDHPKGSDFKLIGS